MLDLEGRTRGADGDREGHLQEPVPLVPLHVGMELKPPRSGSQAHGLGDGRGPEGADEPDRASKRMALHHLDGVHGDQVGDLVEIGAVDVPGVERAWMVVVELEHVAALTVGQHLTARHEIPHRRQQAVTVPLHPKQSVVQPALADGYLFSAPERPVGRHCRPAARWCRHQGQRTVG